MPEAEIALTVILPVFNGEATIREQLEALTDQRWDHPWEVLVVDNGSTDSTAEIVREYVDRCPNWRTISAPAKHNLSYVRNVGAEHAAGTAIAFCDADDLVGSEWINSIGNAVERSPLVVSRMDYAHYNAADPFLASRSFQTCEVEYMFGLPAASGGGLAVQRWLWKRVGGNDEEFSGAGEDFDFSMRVYQKLGIRPVFEARALYHCRFRSGFLATFRQSRAFGKSHTQLYRAHGANILPKRQIARDAVASWWWILSRSPGLMRRDRRRYWIRLFGRRLGRLEGSIRYRVLFL